VAVHPIRIEHGHANVSDRPGLGIEVDEDRIRRQRAGGPVLQMA
jgi:L-alanine-DL-glutamate epimerase-like enolase superfamily enzyme